ncbi:hypothetical protein [Modicisalibacter sp. MOD 31.J]|uniref:hypothetical protein n=1 Tax=Modicisalibacter sp. MOD 31.J TaxID=2831897 RepID=UPI001CCA30F1|nr:hypothetical protein [Modicisalibacter sp. MOD 31.J]MBZ9574566.1 hypothetical protein [Modicisalibacter sp. MOD 31.J]
MSGQYDRTNFIVAMKPAMLVSLVIAWVSMLYLRSQSFSEPNLAESVARLTSPMPLAVTSVVFLLFAIFSPWPDKRESAAGLAAMTTAVLGMFLAFWLASSSLVGIVLILMAACLLSWASYCGVLRHWSQ